MFRESILYISFVVLQSMSYSRYIPRNKQKENDGEEENIEGSALRFMGLSNHSIGIKCIFCKKYTVTYRMVQRRSGDEGMTAEASCGSCYRTFNVGDNH